MTVSDRSQIAAVTAAMQAMADNRCPSSKAEREVIRQHLAAVRERIERAKLREDQRRWREREKGVEG